MKQYSMADTMNSHQNPVVWLNNPFDARDNETSLARRGQTIQQWLDENGGNHRLNRRPTVCFYRGRQLTRTEYAKTTIDAPVFFATLPQGGDGGSNPLALVAMLALSYFAGPAAMAMAGTTPATAGFGTFALKAGIMMAGGVLINTVFPPPGMPAGAVPSSPSPTYSIQAQGNTARLNSVLPVNYGKMRITPEFAAQPYTENQNNDQILFQLFCIGIGENKVSEITFEDTPIENFDDIAIEIVKPFQKVTLFPTAVVQAVEAGGQEMNDAITLGAYRVNPIDTEASRLAVDIIFPAGLIGVDQDDGDEFAVGVDLQITAQQVDSKDNPIGQPVTIHDGVISRCTRTPQRLSLAADVTPGQYMVTVTRRTPMQPSNVVANMQLGGIRGYLVDDNEYGDVTLLAMRARANSNISNAASRQVKCVYERYLPVWHHETGWSELVLTRSPVWAFADVIRSRYGADEPDTRLDLPELYQLDQICFARGDEFNGRFDAETNIWDALSRIGQVCRSAPVRQGNVTRLVRDQKQLLPVAQFGMSKIRNFQMQFGMHNQKTADSVKITYYDEEKNFKQQNVICSLPGSHADNPKEVDLFGVTSRAQAYREGMYLAATNKLRRIPVSWETDTSGFIPSFLDIVLVNHDLIDPQNMASGQVVSTSGAEIILSRDVTLATGKRWYASFTDIYGAPVGPIQIKQGRHPNTINLIDRLPDGFELVTDCSDERTHVIIGAGNDWCRRVKVTSVEPQSDDIVKISGTIEDDDVHDIDDGVVPDPLPDVGIPTPAPGKVSGILITQGGTITAPVINISWQAAASSEKYHIEFSADGRQTWQPAGSGVSYTNYHSFTTRPGEQTIRVAGVGAIRGEWTYKEINAGGDFSKPGKVAIALAEPFTGDALKVSWPVEPAAARYQFEVWAVSPSSTQQDQLCRSLSMERRVTEYSYHYLDAQRDGAGRSLRVRIRAINAANVSGDWSEISATNVPPRQPTGAIITSLVDGFIVRSDSSTEPDIKEFRVYASQESGFVPDPANLVSASETPMTSVSLRGAWYFRLAWVDNWGAAELNYTTEISAVSSDVDFGEVEDALSELNATITANQQEAQQAVADLDAKTDQSLSDVRTELLSNVDTSVKTEETARQTADEALVLRIDTVAADLSTETENRTAAIQTETTARAKADETLASQITTIASELDDETAARKAAIQQEATTRTSADESLARQISQVQAGFESGDNALDSAIRSESEARASADGALGKRIDTVTATANGNNATVQQHTTAIAQVKDGVKKLETSWGVSLDVNGYCAGFVMNNDGDSATALFRADTFAVGAPGIKSFTLAVQDGKVMVNGSFIVNRTITASALNVSSLSAITANLGTATAGTFKTNPSTGARVEISSGGDFPLWVGEGTVTDGNASMYYQKSTKKLVARNMQSERMTATDLTCTRGNFKQVTVQGTIHGEDGYFKGTIYAEKIQGDVPNCFVFTNTAKRFYHTWQTMNEFQFTQTRNVGRFILVQSPTHGYFASTDWRLLWNGQEVKYQRFGDVESIVLSAKQSAGTTGKLTIQMKTWAPGVYKDFPALDGWMITVGYNTGAIHQTA